MQRTVELKSYANIYVYLIQINSLQQRAQKTITPQSANPAMFLCLVKSIFEIKWLFDLVKYFE